MMIMGAIMPPSQQPLARLAALLTEADRQRERRARPGAWLHSMTIAPLSADVRHCSTLIECRGHGVTLWDNRARRGCRLYHRCRWM
jgi:hypothetical protein